MSQPEFSEGVCQDGAAILRDGQPLTISEILALLRQGAEAQERIRELESKLSDLVAYCKDGYGDHEADEIINAEKLLEPPR